jgi:hypothetical protein
MIGHAPTGRHGKVLEALREGAAADRIFRAAPQALGAGGSPGACTMRAPAGSHLLQGVRRPVLDTQGRFRKALWTASAHSATKH